jgi:hypothetical protein
LSNAFSLEYASSSTFLSAASSMVMWCRVKWIKLWSRVQ